MRFLGLRRRLKLKTHETNENASSKNSLKRANQFEKWTAERAQSRERVAKRAEHMAKSHAESKSPSGLRATGSQEDEATETAAHLLSCLAAHLPTCTPAHLCTRIEWTERKLADRLCFIFGRFSLVCAASAAWARERHSRLEHDSNSKEFTKEKLKLKQALKQKTALCV